LAKDRTRPPGASSFREGERKPVTIDLPAEEVGRRPGEEISPGAPEPFSDATIDSAAATEGLSLSPDAAAVARDEPPPELGADESASIPSTAPAFADTTVPPEEATQRKNPSFAAMVGAALVGGVVVGLLILLLSLAGFFRPEAQNVPDLSPEIASLRSEIAELREAASAPPEEGDSLAPLREQLAALEEAVGTLRSEAPAGAPDAALADVQARLAQLENLASGDQPAVDLSGVEQALAELRQQVTEVASAVETLPTSEEVSAIRSDLDAATRKIETAVALAPAVAADALATAVDAGQPFTGEVAALRNLGADATVLDALDAHAVNGVATLPELQSEFEAAIAQVNLDPAPDPDAGALARLLDSAQGLVEVRPAQPTEGDEPPAIVARMRAALAAGDLDAALTEWGKLPEEIRSATSGWAEAARARIETDQLVARLRAEALSRLRSEG
jgi:hypothetical protein